MNEDDVIQILPAAPDSHFRLVPCPVCGSTNVCYVQHEGNGDEYWQAECGDCHHIGMPAAKRHVAQEMWNGQKRALA